MWEVHSAGLQLNPKSDQYLLWNTLDLLQFTTEVVNSIRNIENCSLN